MFKKKEKAELLQIARRAIESYFDFPGEQPITKFSKLKEKGAAFTTITIDDRLRGCIGYIVAVKALYETVWETARSAAFGDPRFPSLKRDEVEFIKIEISVLSPLKELKNLNDFDIGKHGLYIRKGFYSGLLLPQVAVEYNWNREEFLREVCLKAGLPEDAYLQGAEIYKFSAEIFSEN
ncbi:MAG: AmmeMemoRadiSam system protein A [Proteobacteria bacterium]|nr:AmmeMemoRadiSam system protein A [Pseudomonadota bacterium]